MVKLVETNNIKLGREITVGSGETQQKFIEIPSIADMNCAGNSASSLIIDLILRDKFNKDHFGKLKQAILATLQTLKNKHATYQQDDANYSDLAEPLAAFIQFINTNPDWDAFAAYIKNSKTREQIAALHVGLQPALREIGTTNNEKKLKDIGANSQLQDANELKKDGVEAGYEMLDGIAQALDINIHIYRQDTDETRGVLNDNKEAAGYILHVPGHWNFMIRATQTDGLAKVLKTPVASNAIVKFISEEEILWQAEHGYSAALNHFKDQLKHTLFGNVNSIDELKAKVNELRTNGQPQEVLQEADDLLLAIKLQDEEIRNSRKVR